MKAVIVINGKGGIGKDTLINAVVESGATVFNVSTIDPIKDMCSHLNKQGEKDLAYRQLLSDVKKAVDAYYETKNGISYTNEQALNAMTLWHKQTELIGNENSFMFVHIREPENIEKFIDAANQKVSAWKDENISVASLLVTSDRALEDYGNSSDNNVENYDYDLVFESNGTKEEDGERFTKFLEDAFGKEDKVKNIERD